MILLVDRDVDFMIEVYPVCRDETVSGLVRVFLGSLVTLHNHIFLEDGMFCSDVHLLSVPGRSLTMRDPQQRMLLSA